MKEGAESHTQCERAAAIQRFNSNVTSSLSVSLSVDTPDMISVKAPDMILRAREKEKRSLWFSKRPRHLMQSNGCNGVLQQGNPCCATYWSSTCGSILQK